MPDPFSIALAGVAGAGLLVAGDKARKRLALSRAKHPSLAGHVRLGKRVAQFIPFYSYDESRFFRADGVDDAIAARRREGFFRLAAEFKARYPKTLALTGEARKGLSDLQFTSSYRVPFQFSPLVRAHLGIGVFLSESDGTEVVDPDGNRFIDLTGSYGVNLFGYDFYKQCIAEGTKAVEALGPVLGAYHPVVAGNVRRLCDISGLDEVSFHMSGTEAVMQAVRLARYHTGRQRVVRFCGAYHGWWGDVQPGIGNHVPADRTLTLADMSEKTLRVLAQRRNIACVLVNPLQALHPNAGAPADSALIDSSRRASFDKAAYGDWLKRLAETCAKAGIVLIFDEVFVGFRLAPGGAAEYFGVQPDMITYGKTLGGGLPIGVLCGRAGLMKRFREDRPVDVCFARGTFNSHPYVMGAMDAFLRRLETPELRACYDDLDGRWNKRADALNARLMAEDLPVQVANLQTIWTVFYTRPGRYNWMLQYYLRSQGLALSWVGTGRLIFPLNFNDATFAEFVERFVAAAKTMRQDGWWDAPAGLADKAIRRGVLREALAVRWPFLAAPASAA